MSTNMTVSIWPAPGEVNGDDGHFPWGINWHDVEKSPGIVVIKIGPVTIFMERASAMEFIDRLRTIEEGR